MVMAVSKVMPRFLMVGDGIIVADLICMVVLDSLFMYCGDAAIKNSVLKSFSLSMLFASPRRSSSTQDESKDGTNCVTWNLRIQKHVNLHIISINTKV